MIGPGDAAHLRLVNHVGDEHLVQQAVAQSSTFTHLNNTIHSITKYKTPNLPNMKKTNMKYKNQIPVPAS